MAFWTLTRSDYYYLGGILVLIIFELAGSGFLNYWRNSFYTSIELKHLHEFWFLLGEFTIAASALVLAFANRVYLINKYALLKRVDWTLKVQGKWIKNLDSIRVDNPSQRINQDISDLWAMGLDLGSGLLQSILTAIMFTVIIILTTKSNNISPMIILTISYVYAILVVGVTHYQGRILVGLNFMLQKYDADHRTGLSSVVNGLDDSLHNLRINQVKDAGMKVIVRQKILSFFTSTANQISVVLPFLVLAPIYFSGGMTFGYLFQLAAAMGALQLALGYVVDSYPILVKLQATYNRVKFILPLLKED